MKTVLIPEDIAEVGKAYLRERGYSIRMGRGTDKASLLADIADVDAVLFRNEAYDKEILDAAKQVKVMARHGVGVDKVDLAHAEELGIWVTNGATSNSNSVAEMTIGFIIALGRNLLESNKAAHAADYGFRNRKAGMDLEGKTLALLGYGKIGKLVAKKAHYGLGMKVYAYDPLLDQMDKPDYVHKLDHFDDAFRIGDYVSAHYPASEQNNKTITIDQFRLMKQSAYFLNLARGEILVEADLLEALQQGLIAGAALDVMNDEPPKADNPLLAIEHLLLTPHNAALTSDAKIRMALFAAQGIDEVLSGKTPSWPVNNPPVPRASMEVL
ncbi:D-3-phosphoglycerate dehydrogenase [Sphaerochaeta associata]|uniref:Hydroxyacid dehydrogenase n=1 Tax=Sphaerochaeta associata TaxID=1129264 RepID=A0ABY4DCY4_9SPIR|nr:hydroxyacid dehydrogenase [Sphaerochaeta associata]UOM51986.1 hydroxyacid dehydrogenase [Sphaerochaeta associata]SMP58069.1 D-3-phosphoglycerate dehydrogenase [Sphaerochaeta associata]